MFIEFASAAKMLVEELDAYFLAHHVMNAFGILYPQYRCQPNADDTFDKYLWTLMDTYAHGTILEEGDKKTIDPLVD